MLIRLQILMIDALDQEATIFLGPNLISLWSRKWQDPTWVLRLSMEV